MKLGDIQRIENSRDAAPGMGLALDHNGLVPQTVLAPNPTNAQYLRANTTTLQAEWATLGAYTDYTPVLTATTTSPTLGTGNVAIGSYTQIGKLVQGRAVLVFGSGGGAAAGTGTYRISLPVTASTTGPKIGGGDMLDNSANLLRLVGAELATTTTLQMRYDNAGLGLVTDALPWVWAANDQISVYFMYQAA